MKREDLTLKYYDVTVRGELILDPATRLPKKDGDGKIMYTWARLSKPNAGTIAHKLTPGYFYECSLVELNTKESTLTTPSGRVLTLGDNDDRGMVVNIFQSKKPERYAAINASIEHDIKAGTLIVLIEAAEPDVRPVCKISYALPGFVLGYDTMDEDWVGKETFEFWQHQIKKETGIDTPTTVSYIDRKTGKWVEGAKTKTSIGRVFLFPNDFDIFKSIVREEIEIDRSFKVPLEKGTTEHADQNQEIPPTLPVEDKTTV